MISHAHGDCEAGLWRVIDSFSDVKVNDAGGAFSAAKSLYNRSKGYGEVEVRFFSEQ
jgi:hypothetical protein